MTFFKYQVVNDSHVYMSVCEEGRGVCVCVRTCLCSQTMIADMLEGNELIMHTISARYFILPAEFKWGPTDGVVHCIYFRQEVALSQV